VALPPELAAVLREYRELAPANADNFLFVTRNGRPPSSNKVVEYQLWPILDALGIPRCGLHAFRHSVASFIVAEGYDLDAAKQQLRHADVRTTAGYVHRPANGGSQAIKSVAASYNLDTVGHKLPPKPQYIQ
jgi:integrase